MPSSLVPRKAALPALPGVADPADVAARVVSVPIEPLQGPGPSANPGTRLTTHWTTISVSVTTPGAPNPSRRRRALPFRVPFRVAPWQECPSHGRRGPRNHPRHRMVKQLERLGKVVTVLCDGRSSRIDDEQHLHSESPGRPRPPGGNHWQPLEPTPLHRPGAMIGPMTVPFLLLPSTTCHLIQEAEPWSCRTHVIPRDPSEAARVTVTACPRFTSEPRPVDAGSFQQVYRGADQRRLIWPGSVSACRARAPHPTHRVATNSSPHQSAKRVGYGPHSW